MSENIFDTPITPEVQETQDSVFEEQTPVQEEIAEQHQEEVAEGSIEDSVYSEEEQMDANAINVTITDSTAPLIVFYGPPACGKTMTMVRLTRYLSQNGYTVSPVRGFRPSWDKNYSDMCNHFDELVNSDDAAASTGRINFMLIEVMKNGKRFCQLLEAPGEHYFNPSNPNAPFPNFLNTILNRGNRKIWAIMVEPDWMQDADRRNYVNKIVKLRQKMRPRDKNIILFNKIDKTNYVVGPGRIHMKGALKEVKDLYPGLIEMFRNTHPITSIWRSFNCGFVPFQTGDYSVLASNNNKRTFQQGPDEYPARLWAYINKSIRG